MQQRLLLLEAENERLLLLEQKVNKNRKRLSFVLVDSDSSYGSTARCDGRRGRKSNRKDPELPPVGGRTNRDKSRTPVKARLGDKTIDARRYLDRRRNSLVVESSCPARPGMLTPGRLLDRLSET
jgi:hypothetical protein